MNSTPFVFSPLTPKLPTLAAHPPVPTEAEWQRLARHRFGKTNSYGFNKPKAELRKAMDRALFQSRRQAFDDAARPRFGRVVRRRESGGV